MCTPFFYVIQIVTSRKTKKGDEWSAPFCRSHTLETPETSFRVRRFNCGCCHMVSCISMILMLSKTFFQILICISRVSVATNNVFQAFATGWGFSFLFDWRHHKCSWLLPNHSTCLSHQFVMLFSLMPCAQSADVDFYVALSTFLFISLMMLFHQFDENVDAWTWTTRNTWRLDHMGHTFHVKGFLQTQNQILSIVLEEPDNLVQRWHLELIFQGEEMHTAWEANTTWWTSLTHFCCPKGKIGTQNKKTRENKTAEQFLVHEHALPTEELWEHCWFLHWQGQCDIEHKRQDRTVLMKLRRSCPSQSGLVLKHGVVKDRFLCWTAPTSIVAWHNIPCGHIARACIDITSGIFSVAEARDHHQFLTWQQLKQLHGHWRDPSQWRVVCKGETCNILQKNVIGLNLRSACFWIFLCDFWDMSSWLHKTLGTNWKRSWAHVFCRSMAKSCKLQLSAVVANSRRWLLEEPQTTFQSTEAHLWFEKHDQEEEGEADNNKTETFWSPTHILFPCPVEQASTHMLHNPPFSLLLHNKLFKNTPCKWMRLSIFCCSEAFWHFKHLQLHVWVKWNWSFHFLHVFHDKHHFLFFSCFGIPISQIGHCIEQPSHWLIIANKMTQARMTSKTSASWSAKQSLFAHKRLSEITTISETITNPPLNKICMQNFAKFQFSTSQMTLLTTKTGSSAECFCIWTFCQRQVQFSMSFTRFICNAGMQQQFCSVNRFIVLGEKFASQAKHFATQFPNQWTPIPQIQSKWITSSTIWWENPSSQTFALLKLCPVRQRNNNNSEMIHVQSTLSDEVQQQNPHAVHAHTCPDSMACKANHSQCGWGNQWWKRQPRTCTVVTVVNVRLADVQLETLWGPTKEIISCYHSLRNNSNNSPQSVILCYLVWVKSNAEKSSWKWMSISLC